MEVKFLQGAVCFYIRHGFLFFLLYLSGSKITLFSFNLCILPQSFNLQLVVVCGCFAKSRNLWAHLTSHHLRKIALVDFI